MTTKSATVSHPPLRMARFVWKSASSALKLPKKMPYMEVYYMFGQIQIFKYYVVGYELYVYI